MSLHRRVKTLERKAPAPAAPEFDGCQVADADRAGVVRAVLARLQVADPFPQLEDTAFLEQFRRWWPDQSPFAADFFPDWAWAALARLSGLTAEDSVAKIRNYLKTNGHADPFAKAQGGVYLDQWRRASPNY